MGRFAAIATACAVSCALAAPARNERHWPSEEDVKRSTDVSLNSAVSYVALTKYLPYMDSVYAPPGSGPWTNYVYFTYTANAGDKFQVQCSTLTDGKDVDMVISDSTCIQPIIPGMPGPGCPANWTAATDFVEIVTIGNACVGLPSPCTYYIGVSGFTSGQHSFSIVVGDVNIVPIGNGIPTNGQVPVGGQNFYQMTPFTVSLVPGTVPVTLSLNALSGDPDVYVTLSTAPNPTIPGPTSYTFSLAGFQGSNLLTMSYADISRVCTWTSTCYLSVGVYGFTASSYVLTVATNNAIVNLTDSLATSRSVSANGYVYFAYAPPVQGLITIAVTTISGDPDVYVSTQTAYPTQQTWTWAEATPNADEIVFIPTTDPNYVGPPNGVYYIGVYGYGGANATFTILANTYQPNRAVQLLDGVPQAFAAGPHSMAYFAYNVSVGFRSLFGIDIYAVSQQGSTRVYVSNKMDANGNTLFPQPKCVFQNPGGPCLIWGADPATYTFSATDGLADFVSIPPSQVIPGQQLIVGVLAATADGPNGQLPPASIFSITATSGYSTIELQDGVPVPGAVIAAQLKYYKVAITVMGADFVINAAVQTGSVDLYASEGTINPRPVPGNNTYNTSQSGGLLKDKTLRIPFNSLSSACQISLIFGSGNCEIFIAVQGYPNMPANVEAIYTLSAQSTSSPLAPNLLPDGAPIYTYIPSGGAEYFYAFASGTPFTTFYIVVNNVEGTSQLYLNLGTSNKGFWYPGTTVTPDWVSVDAGGYERIVMTYNGSSVSRQGANGHVSRSEPGQLTEADFVIGFSKDSTTGQIIVDDSALAQRHMDAGAKLVSTRADGSAVLQVRLPSPWGDEVTVKDGELTKTVSAVSQMAQRMGAGAFATSEYVKSEGKLTKPAVVSALGGTARALQVDPPGTQPPYCNPCELYITVAAMGSMDCYAQVSFFSAGRVVPLSQDVPTYGDIGPISGPAYYSFAVTDPAADVTISFERIFGQESVYIAVQQPTQPWIVPGPNFLATWSFSPNPFTPSITISHSDPNACNPGDGTAVGAPCTYIVAVYPRGNLTAAYQITASTGISFPVLIDGQTQAGSVTEAGAGSVATTNYYTFQPVGPGYPVPPVQISWTNLVGQIQVYVTNQYVPGVTPSNMLPGPNSQVGCQWSCIQYSGCWMYPGDPCYSPTAPGGNGPVIYTIAVVGTSGVPAQLDEYMIRANIVGDPSMLQLGVPTTDLFIPGRTNTNFSFELPDTTADLIITASVNAGEVIMMVAHDDPNFDVVPGCNPPAPGSQLICNGWTWQANGVGEYVIYIPAATPCQPLLPPGTTGIITGGPCAQGPNYNPAAAFRPGRFWVVVYGLAAFSEMSLTVQELRGPVPRYLLTDGQPQDTQTGLLTVCPNGSRDANSGACNNTKLGANFVVQGSIFVMSVPSSQFVTGANFVQVERLCGGNSTGLCGPNLYIAVNGCPYGQCSPTSVVPYNDNNTYFGYDLRDVIGGFYIPYDACYGPAPPTPAPGQRLPDCVYFIGVYSDNGGVPGKPGFNADPALFRITMTTPAGIQRIAQDCLNYGKVCTLPVHQPGVSGGSRRYEFYSGTPAVPVPTTVTAQLCAGDPSSFAMYACVDNGKCQQVNLPGAGNQDYSAIGNNQGQMQMQVLQGTDIVFLSIVSAGKNNIIPSFQVSLQGGTGPVLVLDPADPFLTVYRTSDLTGIYVAWTTPVLKDATKIGQQPVKAANVVYFVVAFPVGTTGQSQLNNPCGIRDALFNAPNQNSGILFQEVTGNIVLLTGAQPNVAYSVAVEAYCGPETCMLYQQQGQRLAWPVSQSDPIPPAPSASPSPGAGPANNNPAGPSVIGPAVGGAVGGLLVLGLAFFGYTRYFSGGSSYGSSSGSAYARGGSSSYFSSMTVPGVASSSNRFGYAPQRDIDSDLLAAGASSGYAPPSADGPSYSAL